MAVRFAAQGLGRVAEEFVHGQGFVIDHVEHLADRLLVEQHQARADHVVHVHHVPQVAAVARNAEHAVGQQASEPAPRTVHVGRPQDDARHAPVPMGVEHQLVASFLGAPIRRGRGNRLVLGELLAVGVSAYHRGQEQERLQSFDLTTRAHQRLGAAHVDLLDEIGVALGGDLSGQMSDVGGRGLGHTTRDRRLVGQVARHDFSAQVGQHGAAGFGARQTHDRVAAVDQDTHQSRADETRAASDEYPHRLQCRICTRLVHENGGAAGPGERDSVPQRLPEAVGQESLETSHAERALERRATAHGVH